jgi:carbamoyl-phosphate synthase large subunit
MKGKRIFVSGGAGVIGCEIVPLLIERGAEVYVGDLKPRPASFSSLVRYRQGDLNYLTMKELESFAPDIFIHLAATFERSTESYEFWEENFWNNIHLSHHLMTLAMSLSSLRRVVFASSYLIYDPAQYQFNTAQSEPATLKESDEVLPRNLTGMAKLAHEIELRFIDDTGPRSFTTVCARIFRGYGRNSRDVISRWVRMLLDGEPISVYRPEGIFDYIYARDSAEGLIRLADAENVTGIINLGTGRARRVREAVEILGRHFQDMTMIECDSDIPYEASQADMSRFRSVVGGEPGIELEEAIPDIIEYEKNIRGMEVESESMPGHILVTSASKKIPLVQAVQAAARRFNPEIKVIAGDLNEHALARYVADDFWPMPRTEGPEIESLIAGCKKRKICTIIPTRDGELLFWSENQNLFAEEGIEVVVSPVSSIRRCIDKFAFAKFGAKSQLPFIPTWLSPEECETDLLVCKERFGAGSKSIGLKLDRQEANTYGNSLENPVFQPFLEGPEISIDAWLDQNHNVKGLVLRTRDQVIAGESQVTTTFQNEKIESQARKVLEALRLKGPVVLQAILDDSDDIHVIECNSRFGGASTTSIEAGLDIFYWTLLEQYAGNLDDYPFERVSGEVRQIRVPRDIHDRRF